MSMEPRYGKTDVELANIQPHTQLLKKIERDVRKDERRLKHGYYGSKDRGFYQDNTNWKCSCGCKKAYVSKIGTQLFSVCPECGRVYLMSLLWEKEDSMYSESWHRWQSWTWRQFGYREIGVIKLETFERTQCDSPACEKKSTHKCKCGQLCCGEHWWERRRCYDCHHKEWSFLDDIPSR